MKSRKSSRSFFTLLLLVSTTIASHHGMATDSVESMVTKARAYLGSEEALKGIQSLQYRGKITLFQGKDAEGNELEPLVGECVLSYQKPFNQHVQFVLPSYTMTTGFNGHEGFELFEQKDAQGNPARQLRSIGGDELRRNKANILENMQFFRPFEISETNVIDHGTTTLDGKQVQHIDFIHNGRFVFSRFFDVSNGDLVKTVLDTGMETYESGEKLVEGIRFSTQNKGKQNGETRYLIEFDQIIVNPELDSTIFNYPLILD